MAQHLKLFSISREDPDYVRFIQVHPNLDQLEDDKVLEAMVNEWFAQNPNIKIRSLMGPTYTGNRIFIYAWFED